MVQHQARSDPLTLLVSSANMSFLGLTMPHKFLSNVWPDIVNSRNGLADRFNILYHKPYQLEYEKVELSSEKPRDFSVRSLGSL